MKVKGSTIAFTFKTLLRHYADKTKPSRDHIRDYEIFMYVQIIFV